MIEEEWRPIEELPHYLISNYGNVKHTTRADIRNVSVNERGFPVILLSSATSPTRYLRQINMLVAKAFLPPPLFDNQNAIWHKDGNLINCHADNLRWEQRSWVLEWNDMHRRGHAKYMTPAVKNNRTGVVYRNAYECAIAEGYTESNMIFKIEHQGQGMYSDTARYKYTSELEEGLLG